MLYINFSPYPIESTILFGILVIFLWIFIESILLSSWGTTVGKWLLKIKLRDNKDKKLVFSIALHRSFLVWFKGCGIGFPFVYLFTLIVAHRDLKKKGVTSWDKDCNLKVIQQKIGIIRLIVMIVLISSFILLSVWARLTQSHF